MCTTRGLPKDRERAGLRVKVWTFERDCALVHVIMGIIQIQSWANLGTESASLVEQIKWSGKSGKAPARQRTNTQQWIMLLYSLLVGNASWLMAASFENKQEPTFSSQCSVLRLGQRLCWSDVRWGTPLATTELGSYCYLIATRQNSASKNSRAEQLHQGTVKLYLSSWKELNM